MTTETAATRSNDLTLTVILDAMERAAEADTDLALSHDAAQGTHKIEGASDTLTVAWQEDCEDPGWTWWLVSHDPETGYCTSEESGGLDSVEELESILDSLT